MTAAGATGDRVRPRVIVTTDPELDDLNSMLRLVLYANEIDLAGLVYSSSQFHWAGDPARGIEPHRWPPAGARGHIDQAIDAYAEVWGNLSAHDPRYPSPARLRSLVRQGNIANVGDMEHETDGSRLIADVLTDGEGPVFLQAWGGLNTIGRALRSIEDAARADGTWDAVYRDVVSRAVVTSFGKQDSAWDEYIRPHWPELELREVATMAWGYFARMVVRPEDQVYLTPEWMREHVSGVGPIGRAYRVWGDGLQMAEGFDDEDYFGIAGATEGELAALGYRVWCPVFPAGAWISEGDSSNFAMHIDNGLRNWEGPHFGGWGGRQAPSAEDAHEWSSAHADDALPEGMAPVETPFGTTVNDFAAARWLGAFQRDLAARLQWSVTPRYADANHAPELAVRPGVDVTARAGAAVELGLSATDPDGDAVRLSAWEYREAGSCATPATVELTGMTLVIRVPADARKGDAIHVIVEAVDDAPVPLTSYARVVIAVA